ncbi:PREDICTED: dentin sialophosphoprotein-like, partial [Nicrophorus vespilloides]|uniref:Dentin sialophosphoprotein-like n=1 Tax=Nicrophorus vespilloides TaxID=110193 RepID=A0ABM1M1Q9_NICVS
MKDVIESLMKERSEKKDDPIKLQTTHDDESSSSSGSSSSENSGDESSSSSGSSSSDSSDDTSSSSSECISSDSSDDESGSSSGSSSSSDDSDNEKDHKIDCEWESILDNGLNNGIKMIIRRKSSSLLIKKSETHKSVKEETKSLASIGYSSNSEALQDEFVSPKASKMRNPNIKLTNTRNSSSYSVDKSTSIKNSEILGQSTVDVSHDLEKKDMNTSIGNIWKENHNSEVTKVQDDVRKKKTISREISRSSRNNCVIKKEVLDDDLIVSNSNVADVSNQSGPSIKHAIRRESANHIAVKSAPLESLKILKQSTKELSRDLERKDMNTSIENICKVKHNSEVTKVQDDVRKKKTMSRAISRSSRNNCVIKKEVLQADSIAGNSDVADVSNQSDPSIKRTIRRKSENHISVKSAPLESLKIVDQSTIELSRDLERKDMNTSKENICKLKHSNEVTKVQDDVRKKKTISRAISRSANNFAVKSAPLDSLKILEQSTIELLHDLEKKDINTSVENICKVNHNSKVTKVQDDVRKKKTISRANSRSSRNSCVIKKEVLKDDSIVGNSYVADVSNQSDPSIKRTIKSAPFESLKKLEQSTIDLSHKKKYIDTSIDNICKLNNHNEVRKPQKNDRKEKTISSASSRSSKISDKTKKKILEDYLIVSDSVISAFNNDPSIKPTIRSNSANYSVVKSSPMGSLEILERSVIDLSDNLKKERKMQGDVRKEKTRSLEIPCNELEGLENDFILRDSDCFSDVSNIKQTISGKFANYSGVKSRQHESKTNNSLKKDYCSNVKKVQEDNFYNRNNMKRKREPSNEDNEWRNSSSESSISYHDTKKKVLDYDGFDVDSRISFGDALMIEDNNVRVGDSSSTVMSSNPQYSDVPWKLYEINYIDTEDCRKLYKRIGISCHGITNDPRLQKAYKSSCDVNSQKSTNKSLEYLLNKLEQKKINSRSMPDLLAINDNKTRMFQEHEDISQMFYSKTTRTKLYSGIKVVTSNIPTLSSLCNNVIQKNVESLVYTRGASYALLKPILEKLKPNQLLNLEKHNPYIIDESEELWSYHCKKQFHDRNREYMETSRNMYMRCKEERKMKLSNIVKHSQDKNVSRRQTQLCFLDAEEAPSPSVAKKEIKKEVRKKEVIEINKPLFTPDIRRKVVATSSSIETVSSPENNLLSQSKICPKSLKKMAPLMQKAQKVWKEK